MMTIKEALGELFYNRVSGPRTVMIRTGQAGLNLFRKYSKVYSLYHRLKRNYKTKRDARNLKIRLRRTR